MPNVPAPAPYPQAFFMGVLRRAKPVSSYFLDLCYPRTFMSTDEYIDIADIPDAKKLLAPLVMPTSAGKPTYTAAEEARRFKPPYVKPKDAVTAAAMASRQVGLGELFDPTPMTPAARFDAAVANLAVYHRDIIMRRLEWLAARAVIDGMVTLEGPGYPTRVVSFGRSAAQDIVLAAADSWDNPAADILGDVEDWLNIGSSATSLSNGPFTRMTVGTNVAKALKKNENIVKLLSTLTNQWSGGVSVNTGITALNSDTKTTFIGMLSPTLSVYQNSDYYQDSVTGAAVPYLDPNEIVLTGDVQGIKAFGAILDKQANLQAIPIFQKTFDENDPSATFVLSQSAPLAIPLYPNATFRAKVITS